MTAAETVILASSSPTRRRLLEAAGVALDIAPPRVDEDAVRDSMVADGADADAIAEALAELKARAASRRHAARLVIGADQVLDHQGTILAKPPDLATARAQLLDLRGSEHALVSSACVVRDSQRLWHATDRARLFVRPFSDAFLDDYLAVIGDQALDGPGAYRLEGLGAQLFAWVRGDYFTILGLPLLPLLEYLRAQRVLRT